LAIEVNRLSEPQPAVGAAQDWLMPVTFGGRIEWMPIATWKAGQWLLSRAAN
jgi:hypothetical protein